jgi:peptide/nickel transport system substrate-binding protein
MRVTWLPVLHVITVFAGGGLSPCGAYSEISEVSQTPTARFSGRLVVAHKAEPRTLKPFAALDVASREAIGLLHADLIHINRQSFKPEPSIALNWTVSKDGRTYTMRLRRGVRFSDGHPFTADDVLFTFQAHMDRAVNSSERETLLFDGKFFVVRKLDEFTVEFTVPTASASAERVFDSVVIAPEHLLARAYRRGEITKAWPLTTMPLQVAGLGPFRLKEYIPGQRRVIERNPHYWRVERSRKRLPYLDEIAFQFVGSEDAQRLHFEAGQSHLATGMNPLHFASVRTSKSRGSLRLIDHGPGVDYSFLVFNQNDPPAADTSVDAKQNCFRQTAFRQAISSAIDRDAIVRIAFRGLASPIWTHVTPGNGAWLNRNVPKAPPSLTRARQILAGAQFKWDGSGRLLEPTGQEVAFSILTSVGNVQRVQIATIIQDDLKQLGIRATVVALEFRTMLKRVFETHDYDAPVMTLTSADIDPNAQMNVWKSKGSTRLWKLRGGRTASWERELDGLMHKQAAMLDPVKRKRLYDRVQLIIAEQLPIIGDASSHVLVGAWTALENVQPSMLRLYVLGTAGQIYFRKESARR